MNFLAHAHLSPPDKPIVLIGNTLGDFINPKKHLSLHSELLLGIYLHRAIDSYTDTHAYVRQARSYLFARSRHYSRVLVDIFFDHFLAKQFKNYSLISLHNFSENVYSHFYNYKNKLPKQTYGVGQAMQAGNWLEKYQTIDGINTTLNNMANRLGGKAQVLRGGAQDLADFYLPLEESFKNFYPQVQQYAQLWLQKNTQAK